MALRISHETPDTKQWAKHSLTKAGVSTEKVVRVFPPLDTAADDVIEVLYLDERGRPRTAWLRADGSVSLNTAGW